MLRAITTIRKYFNQPPNLDEIFNRFKKKMQANAKKRGYSNKMIDGSGGLMITAIALVVLILWGLAGIVIVAPAEKGVVLRFGRFVRMLGPGPHWVPPLIEHVDRVNVLRDYSFSTQAEMLTKDKNIVDVEVSVVFRINQPMKYLYNVVDPYESVTQATASALRQVVGSTTLDGILTQNRAVARTDIEKQIIATIQDYDIGIEIIDVNLQPAKPPEQVSEAFNDVIKALEDEKRFINEAKAYREKVVPIAKGRARRIIEESEAYASQVVLDAKAQVASYLAIQPQYQNAPEVIGNNMYFSKLQNLYQRVNKVLLDIPKNQNAFMYLPLEQIMQKAGQAQVTQAPSSFSVNMPMAKTNTVRKYSGR